MSYKGKILRGEKFAVLYKEDEMKKLGGSIWDDYQAFLESEKKVKEKLKTNSKGKK